MTTTSMPMDFDVRVREDRTPEAERERLMAEPGFGQVFTDHMITIKWTEDEGWHEARLEPYAPLSIDPSCSVLHYGQEIFEGLKAYRQNDGQVVAFRPYANAARMNRSARRMAMPELPEATFVKALELLVDADRDWVPTREGHSLYLRPFMIATGTGLGVNHSSSSFMFLVIASPSASYFSGDPKAVSVWLSRQFSRAAPGGTGEAKCGGNYAGSFAGQAEAVANGCDQVVWLDAKEHRWVEEMGTSNVFFVYGSGDNARLKTSPLTGTLLPGVTRDSLIRLAPDLGIPVEEKAVSIEDWQADCASGELTEVFACGTATVVTPVGYVKSETGEWAIGDGKPGPVSARLHEELLGIQWGTRPDPYGWLHTL